MQLRCLLGLALILPIVVLAPRPAGAIVPSNDVVSGAALISDITFPGAFKFQNTSEATTDLVDSALNASCGAEATEASVWYKVVAPSDAGITINATLSFYSARVIVAKGEPDALEFVACSPARNFNSLVLPSQAGETFYLLVFDDVPGEGNGGELQLFVAEAIPAPQLTVSVDDVATFDPATGIATVTGTYHCSGSGLGTAKVFGQMTQHTSGHPVVGFFQTEIFEQPLPCDGVVHHWTETVFGSGFESGRGRGDFKGGPAEVTVDTRECGRDFCAEASDTKIVSLHSAGNTSQPPAPPPNDTLEQASDIGTTNGAFVVDTSQATTDGRDATLNDSCGAAATEASVWFTLPGPQSEPPVVLDATGSDYSATLMLVTGAPDDLSLVACEQGRLTTSLPPPPSYLVVVDDVPGEGNGGTLSLSISNVDAPHADLAISPTGHFDSVTGSATVSGMITCSGADESGAFMFGSAIQTRGRPTTVTSGGFTMAPCDGTPRSWTLEFVSQEPWKFAGGPVAVSIEALVSAPDFGSLRVARVDTTVTLRG